jgi:hypothetical protein
MVPPAGSAARGAGTPRPTRLSGPGLGPDCHLRVRYWATMTSRVPPYVDALPVEDVQPVNTSYVPAGSEIDPATGTDAKSPDPGIVNIARAPAKEAVPALLPTVEELVETKGTHATFSESVASTPICPLIMRVLGCVRTRLDMLSTLM